jgi:hypothetical protein
VATVDGCGYITGSKSLGGGWRMILRETRGLGRMILPVRDVRGGSRGSRGASRLEDVDGLYPFVVPPVNSVSDSGSGVVGGRSKSDEADATFRFLGGFCTPRPGLVVLSARNSIARNAGVADAMTAGRDNILPMGITKMSEKSETWSKYWDHNDVEYKQGSLNGDKLESIQPNFPAVLFNNILWTRESSLSCGVE